MRIELRSAAVRWAGLVLASYVACWFGLYAWRAYAPYANPHAFMKDAARCRECHLEGKPEKGRPYRMQNFTKDITSLCDRCHHLAVSHPVDVAPGRVLGDRLPLDSEGTMTCVTCHYPHGEAFSNRMYVGRNVWEKVRDTLFPILPGRFRTNFLRIPNPNGELCESCHTKKPVTAVRREVPVAGIDKYAGSKACASCHASEYAQWRLTSHARMLRSPRRDPKAVVASFEGAPPFPAAEIAYVLGNRNVQRFISRRDDSLVVRTPIWLIRAKKWNLTYWRELDWIKLCAGCHTTGINPAAGEFAEEAVGCEACHGPGKAHASNPGKENIVNPERLSADRRDMICESCHTTGHDTTGEYRYPVGYLPGSDLARFFQGLTPKPNQDDATFHGDGSYADRRRQFQFWQTQMLIVEGETCDLCKNFREGRKSTSAEPSGPKKMTSQEYCESCHDGTLVPPPRFHSGADAKGKPCLSCHPVRRSAGGSPSIHDHKFLPATALPKNDFLPKSDFRSICFGCHTSQDKGA